MLRSAHLSVPGCVLRWSMVLLLTLLAGCGGGGGTATSAGANDNTPTTPPGALIVEVASSPMLEGMPIRFTGRASGGRAPLGIDWDFGDGSVATGSQTAQHSYAQPGQYQVSFRVTDAAGNRATASTSALIEPRTGLSIAADRSAYTVGQTVRLSPAGPYGAAQAYEWDLGDGRRASGPSVELSYPTMGERTVTLVASYAQGFQRTASATIAVSTGTPSLTLSAPSLIYPLQPATLSASQDADASGATEWDFGDGSVNLQGGASTSHSYARAGTYLVTARRSNKTGFQVSATMSVTVLPPPAPSGLTLSFGQNQATPDQGSPTVILNSRVADMATAFGARFSWDFGDGSRPADDPWDCSHTYAAAGTYVVTLTLTNGYGLSAKATATLSVGPRQVLKLLAGQGAVNTLADGPALSARLLRPGKISFDAAGNLYISDTGNARVRRLSTRGEVSTLDLAGDFQLAAFGDGGLLVTDGQGQAAHRIEPDGRGQRDERLQKLGSILSMARSPSGTVAVGVGTSIWRLDPDGSIVELVHSSPDGSPDDGPGALAMFGIPPWPMGYDAAGMLYVATSCRVRKVAPDGSVATLAGATLCGAQDGMGTQARLQYIDDLAVAPDGTVYVLQAADLRIRKISPAGLVTTLPLTLDMPGGDSASPRGLALSPAGVLHISDARNNVIRRVNADHSLSIVAGQLPLMGRVDGRGAAAVFSQPHGIIQGPGGALYVADGGHRALRRITLDGEVTTLAVFAGSAVQVLDPHPFIIDGMPSLGHVAVDDQEKVYVADTLMNVIRRVAPDGNATVMAGLAGVAGFADGKGAQARFQAPIGVTVDAARNVYVGDTFDHAIRRIAPDGTVTTVAGLPGHAGYRDGMGPGASFSYPSAVTAAADGTLWVADFGNALLRRISTSGSVTTVAGCHPDWHMDRGCVYAPMGLSRDAASGDVYVASVRVGISRLRADGRIEPLLPGGTEARLRLGALPGAVGRPRGVALLSNGQLALTTDNAVLVTGFAP